MITYETLIRKLAQKKQLKRFRHKTRYGRELEERYGYDQKGHIEEYQRTKESPEMLFKMLFE
jgi:hypothetical protein